MLISVVSSKSSPGGSTAALALALKWPRPVLLAELDPRGGDLLWGYGRGQNVGAAGLLRMHLSARDRSMADSVWAEVVALPGEGKWWLPGLLNSREAGSMDWAFVARALRSLPNVDVIADCGSVFGDPGRLPRLVWTSSDLAVLAVRPTLQGVRVASNAGELLRDDLIGSGMGAERLVSMVVGCSRAYPTSQIAGELGQLAPVVGELPYDRDSADVLGGLRDQGRRFERGSLMQAAGKLAEQLGARATAPTWHTTKMKPTPQPTAVPGVGQNLVTPRMPVVAPGTVTPSPGPGAMPGPWVGGQVAGPNQMSAPMTLKPIGPSEVRTPKEER